MGGLSVFCGPRSRLTPRASGCRDGARMNDAKKPLSVGSKFLDVACLGACLFFWAAILTFDIGDWPSPHQFPHNAPPHNACGLVGAWAAFQLLRVLGDGAFPLILFCTLASLLAAGRGRIGNLFERTFGLTLVVLSTSAAAHLVGTAMAASLPSGHGGLVGYALGDWMTEGLSRFGTVIVLASSWIVGLIFTTQGWVFRVPRLVGRAARATGETAALAKQLLTAVARPRPLPVGNAIARPTVPALIRVPAAQGKHVSAAGGASDEERDVESKNWPQRDSASKTRRLEANGDESPAAGAKASVTGYAASVAPSAAVPAAPPPTTPAAAPKRTFPVPIVNFPTPRQPASAEPYPKQIENWRLPDIQLLREPEYNFTKQQEAFVRQQAKVLEETLQEFRIEAQVVEIDTGPVITMFELRLGSGVKVSQIGGLSNDIARALKAHAIRVVAPISGKNTVGIEVPNVKKERVRLRELMTMAGGKASGMGLPLFLGKDAGGAALVTDLTAMPHMLIAGTTGSGKSVCLNTIIVSLVMTKRPDHVKMILIDPKMVEMSQFKEIPHLMCPIVTDMVRAEKILEWAVTNMEERYELLAEARVKNIDGYNALSPDEIYARFAPETEEEKSQIPTHLPFVVIIIDELADLMMTAAKEVEHHLSRLAQKSRAVGIHIIVATQRPEVKVVTGLIKSNMPARVCFRVASRMDSRIVLDQNGGEVLMGQGDMLFLPPGSHKLMRAQGTFLEDAEVHAVLEDLISRAKPEFHPELVRLRTADLEAGFDMRDPLFDDAVRIILESKRGSVSLLQRRLTIGYSRASRLIDQMAEAGIVGDYKGSQAREVVMTLEQWETLQDQIRADRESCYAADQDDGPAGGAPHETAFQR